MDRNGKLVTRHVRPAAAEKPSTALPAPAASQSSGVTVRSSAARMKPRKWAVDRWFLNMADTSLLFLSSSYVSSHTYSFVCTDVEAYDVMSVVTPPNAVPILATGARNAEEAVGYLRENNLGHLIQDNSDFEREVLERNLSAEKLVRGYVTLPADAFTSEYFMDALEATTMSSLDNKTGWQNSVVRKVLQGKIDLADIKTIGVTQVTSLSLSEMENLEAMKSGELGFDAAAYRDLVARTNVKKNADRYTASAVINLAKTYGADEILTLRDPAAAVQLNNYLMARTGYPKERIPSALLWADELVALTKFPVNVNDLIKLQDAGVSVQRAAAGYADDLTAQQIIGMYNGIEPSVSEGWL